MLKPMHLSRSLVAVVVCVAFGYRGFLPLTTFGVAAFVTVVTLRELLLPAKQRVDATKESWGTAVFMSASRARRTIRPGAWERSSLPSVPSDWWATASIGRCGWPIVRRFPAA